jgi:RNA polymerase sigma-70 factor (ECF subfamily)
MSVRRPEAILDELLVLRCRAGDRWAAERLAERWHPRLLRHAWRLTGQEDAAADAVQEAWLAIVRGLARLDDPARFRAWAYRITGNKCRDWIRRQSRTRRVRERLAHEPRLEAVDPEPVSAPPERAEQRLARAIEDLPAQRRALLAMFYSQGLSVGEISGALGIAAGTVKSRLFHARRALRRTLEVDP